MRPNASVTSPLRHRALDCPFQRNRRVGFSTWFMRSQKENRTLKPPEQVHSVRVRLPLECDELRTSCPRHHDSHKDLLEREGGTK
jgi:hypothetical protein